MENNFYMICYDCLYYGCYWGYIKEKYSDIVEKLGIDKAKKIYDKAKNKISEGF